MSTRCSWRRSSSAGARRRCRTTSVWSSSFWTSGRSPTAWSTSATGSDRAPSEEAARGSVTDRARVITASSCRRGIRRRGESPSSGRCCLHRVSRIRGAVATRCHGGALALRSVRVPRSRIPRARGLWVVELGLPRLLVWRASRCRLVGRYSKAAVEALVRPCCNGVTSRRPGATSRAHGRGHNGDYDAPRRSAYSTLRNGHSAAIQSPTLRHNGTSRSARLARTHESTRASCSLSRTG